MERQSPVPSINIDELFKELPDINANIIAVVLRQYDVPEDLIRSAFRDMINQTTRAQRFGVKASPLALVKPDAKYEFWKLRLDQYSFILDQALNRSVRFNVADIDPETITREHPSIKRGDVVHLRDGEDYRNSDCYIWNGKKAVELYYDIDDYGSLPQSFTLREFPDPHYFDNSIDHNYIRWLEFEKKEITKFVPGEFFVVSIGGRWYNIDLATSWERKYAKYKSKSDFYESLSFPLPVSIWSEESVWTIENFGGSDS